MHVHMPSPATARTHAMLTLNFTLTLTLAFTLTLTLTLTLSLTFTLTLPRTAYALIAIPILFGVQVPGFEGEFGNLNSASAVSANPVYVVHDLLENNSEIQMS